MIINSVGGNVRGNVSGESFKIEQSATTFAVLSQSLYKEPIKAILRELSTNAVDAHTMAKHAKPFDIHLPTVMNPSFYIRDYGTGLSLDELNNVYTSYFTSSKRDNNDAIGCFGLGSKTPFAYTSQYTVESFYNGTHYICMMYLENGIPKFQVVSDNPTKEPNGLKITFPVKSADCPNFEKVAQSIFIYFKIKPNFVGKKVTIPTLTYTKSYGNCHIRNNDYVGMQVIMGNIAYPVKFEDVKLTKVQNTLFNLPIDIEVPIGYLSLIPSREGLQYDIATISKLIGILNKFEKDLLSKAQNKIDNCIDEFEASIKLSDIINSCGHEILTTCSPNFNYKGKYIESYYRVDVSNKQYQIYALTKSSKQKKPLTRITNHLIADGIFCHDAEKTATRANQYNLNNPKINYILYGDKEEFKKDFGLSNDRLFKFTSQLPKAGPKSKNSSASLKSYNTYDAAGYYYSSSVSSTTHSIDFTKPFYYIIGSKTVTYGYTHKIYVSYRKYLNSIGKSFPSSVFIINKKEVSKLNLTNGINIDDEILTTVNQLVIQYPDYDKEYIGGWYGLTDHITKIVKLLPTWKIGQDYLGAVQCKNKNQATNLIDTVLNPTKKQKDITSDMFKKYPLVRCKEAPISHLVKYIQLVDNNQF